MHTLTVELAATYLVGAGQWVVHNADERLSLRDAYEKARTLAGVQGRDVAVARVNFFYDINNPDNSMKIRSLANQLNLPYDVVEQRIISSVADPANGRGIRPRYNTWNVERLSVRTTDPGAVGTIHIYNTPRGSRGVVLHHATYEGIFAPHLHAALPKPDGLTPEQWALAMINQNEFADRYEALSLPDGDHHILCKLK